MSIFFWRNALIFGILLILPLAGCSGGSPDRPAATEKATFDPVHEANEIMGLEREWSRRYQAKDVDWIMKLYTDESRQFPPDAEPVVGLKAIHAAWEKMAHTKGLQIIWEPVEAHVSETGDLAYDFGTVVTFSPAGRRTDGKYLVTWVRRDGDWKVGVAMYSQNVSPPK